MVNLLDRAVFGSGRARLVGWRIWPTRPSTPDGGRWRTASPPRGITCRSRCRPGRPGCGSSWSTTAPAEPSSTWAASARTASAAGRAGPVTSFVITTGAATPGYLPGELEAGTWQVMIGVHRVPPDGAGFRVTAETTPRPGALARAARARAAAPAGRPPRRELPASAGHRWLAGDLHAHTVHSRRRADRPRAGRPGRRARARLPRRHRSQHVSHHAELAAASAPVRDHPAARPGGDHRRRARRRARRRGLDRLPARP